MNRLLSMFVLITSAVSSSAFASDQCADRLRQTVTSFLATSGHDASPIGRINVGHGLCTEGVFNNVCAWEFEFMAAPNDGTEVAWVLSFEASTRQVGRSADCVVTQLRIKERD